MDSDFLKNLEYFTVPNNQTANLNAPAQGGESSTAGAARNTNEAAFWEALAGAESGVPSAAPASSGPSDAAPTFAQPSAGSATSYRQYTGQTYHGGPKQRTLPTRPPPPHLMSPRKRDSHDKKRQKADPDSAALESVDYWIQFDDDDADNNLGSSFEIDYSRRQNPTLNNFARPASRLNPLPETPGLGSGLYTTPLFREDDFIDDNALDNALSEDEDPLDSMNLSEQLSTIDTQPPQEVPPREGLYSTPLSWEKPAPGIRLNPLFGLGTPMLDPEQRRLLAIALNTGGSANSLATSFGLGTGAEFGSDYSSLGNLGGSATASLSEISRVPGEERAKGKGKEKEADYDGFGAFDKPPPKSAKPQSSKAMPPPGPKGKGKEQVKLGDRTAHNDIERKYRTNLKDKIAELRDAVPSLRSMPDEGDEEEDEDQSRSAPKVSKGTVLLKATEYINHLEKRNKAIMKEHQDLARRLQAFEQLLTATARQPFPMPNYSRNMFDPRGFC